MTMLKELKPALVWKHFDAIRQIPRCSRNEAAAGAYVKEFAKTHQLKVREDNAGNIAVTIPASPGHEKSPGVVLQGHLDMVCEKNSDKSFDFDNDPIEAVVEGEWVTANGTTLGADNGIGMAAALAAAEDASVTHGPLELLFTTDEETGLNGANALKSDFLDGRILINLDSEEEGTFYIGCAGGGDTEMTLPVQRIPAKKSRAIRVSLKGLRGGHSGIDIQTGRGNAIQLLARMLFDLTSDFELVSLEGGSKHNAIPREAFAVIITDDENNLKSELEKLAAEIKFEYKTVEKDMAFVVEPAENNLNPLKETDKNRFIQLVLGLPHGVVAMSQEIKGLVETSNNLAIVKSHESSMTVYTSSRSSVHSALEAIRRKIEAVADLANAKTEQLQGYPAWTPNLDSPILKTMKTIHHTVTGKEARVEAIHAGLECGIIGEKYDGMDMISFGPDLQNPHSPDERVHIESVGRFYNLLKETLKALA